MVHYSNLTKKLMDWIREFLLSQAIGKKGGHAIPRKQAWRKKARVPVGKYRIHHGMKLF